LDGLERESRIEYLPHGTHGWIVNVDYSVAAKPRCYAGAVKTSKRLSEFSVEEIP